MAIRGRVPLDIIKPFPMFSEIYLGALIALHGEIATAQPVAEVAP
jgi:hypothetical protein